VNDVCLHTHTDFCDGEGGVEDFCRAAYDKKIPAIGFSAHAPLPAGRGLTSTWHLPEARLGEYVTAVRDAGRRWAGRLRVYLGLEIDYIDGVMGPGDARFRDLGLDYVIGAVHYVIPPAAKNPFTVDGPLEEVADGVRDGFGGDGEAMADAYWDAVEALLRARRRRFSHPRPPGPGQEAQRRRPLLRRAGPPLSPPRRGDSGHGRPARRRRRT